MNLPTPSPHARRRLLVLSAIVAPVLLVQATRTALTGSAGVRSAEAAPAGVGARAPDAPARASSPAQARLLAALDTPFDFGGLRSPMDHPPAAAPAAPEAGATAPEVPEEGATDAEGRPDAEADELRTLELTGVMAGGAHADGGAAAGMAVINGEVHRVGDRVVGVWSLAEIDPRARRVRLVSKDGRAVWLVRRPDPVRSAE